MNLISLGAGVQSSTLFLMACFGEIGPYDAAIFADTGWEPPNVYEWLEWLAKVGFQYGLPIYIVQQGNILEDILNSQVRRYASMPFFVLSPEGKRGQIRRQCTSEYKITPLKKKERELAGYKKYARIPAGEVIVAKGISLDEAKRASMSDDRWVIFDYPLIELEMTRNDCLNWFDRKGLPLPPRSACVGCPYHTNSEWRKIRDEMPEQWKQAVELDHYIRKMDGMRGDVYLHADMVPLDEVDLTTAEDHGQLSLFRDECQGICGV